MRRTRGFTLVEILMAFLIAGFILTGLIQSFGDAFQRYLASEDTLSDLSESQLLLAHLGADVERCQGEAPPDASVSPGTGTTFPKHVMHLVHAPGASRLTAYDVKLEGTNTGFADGHPLAEHDVRAPGVIPVMQRLAWIQNTMAWVQPADPKATRYFVIQVADGPLTRRVTYRFEPEAGVVIREDQGREVRIGRGSVREFWAVPYVELLIPPPGPQAAPALLKTWVEVRIVMRAPEESGARIDKRRLELQTRMAPRHFNARLHGNWGL